MKTITTLEYPTRYVATANPGVWVDHGCPEPNDDGKRVEFTPTFRGGFEVACYREPWPSTFHPTLWHGIDIDVFAHAMGGVVLDCNLTHNDWGRTSKRMTRWLKGPHAVVEAKRLALEWLAQFRSSSDEQLALFAGGAA